MLHAKAVGPTREDLQHIMKYQLPVDRLPMLQDARSWYQTQARLTNSLQSSPAVLY